MLTTCNSKNRLGAGDILKMFSVHWHPKCLVKVNESHLWFRHSNDFSKRQFGELHSKKGLNQIFVQSTDAQPFPCYLQLPLLMATGIETLVVVWRHPWYGLRMRAVATHPVHPLRDCFSTRQQHTSSDLVSFWAELCLEACRDLRGFLKWRHQLLLYQWRPDTLWSAYY